MAEDDKYKKCPQYCPFLMANGTFCELFKCTLQATHGAAIKCEECKNPVQRMSSYKSLNLSSDSRAEMWHKAVLKYNEIELGHKRQEEGRRQKFAAFLEEKFGNRPPLEGNTYLKNLIINLYMVMDMTERSMMMTVLSGRGGDALLQSINRAPKDENLLRNVRRELDDRFKEYQQTVQQIQNQRLNENQK